MKFFASILAGCATAVVGALILLAVRVFLTLSEYGDSVVSFDVTSFYRSRPFLLVTTAGFLLGFYSHVRGTEHHR